MPMWRCPHCGTPQAETARCWVCKRSSTACGTCRDFRHSVAGSLGFCGMDRTRQPLAGDEIRPCWEAWPAGADATLTASIATQPANPTDRPAGPIDFVEIADGSALDATAAAAAATTTDEPAVLPLAPILPASEPGWSLWGDIDR